MDEFYYQQDRNAYYVPNIHYRQPKKVDPLRISQSVKKNMLKENGGYQKQEEDVAKDVNLVSKDMELIFSNKNDDDDELETKPNGIATIDEPEEDKNERLGVLAQEEQKSFYEDDFSMQKKETTGRQTIGRGKMQEQIVEPILDQKEHMKK